MQLYCILFAMQLLANDTLGDFMKRNLRDLRDYAKQSDRRMIIGGLLLLFVVGGGLIWWFYGTPAAGLGVTCLMAGLAPIVIIVFLFFAIERILKSAGRK